jgi:hypothetical protein
VENPADQLKRWLILDSIFVLFRLLSRLYNFICTGFQPAVGLISLSRGCTSAHAGNA